MSTAGSQRSLFDQLGGEPVLRVVIDRFVDRVFDDTMIGFFFRNANRARVKSKEYEHAAQHLGAPVLYTGQALGAAHGRHPILGGHFMRRMQILKEVLQQMDAPEAVIEHWLAVTEQLRPLITAQPSSECSNVGGAAVGERGNNDTH